MSRETSGADSALNDMPTIEDSFGCDPWDAENFGKHPASRADAAPIYVHEEPSWKRDL